MASEVLVNSMEELEKALDHAFQSLARWRQDIASTLIGSAADYALLALLAAVHKDAKAKTIHELLRLVNRVGVPVVQLREMLTVGGNGCRAKRRLLPRDSTGRAASASCERAWSEIPMRLAHGSDVLTMAEQAAVCLGRLRGIYDAATGEVISRSLSDRPGALCAPSSRSRRACSVWRIGSVCECRRAFESVLFESSTRLNTLES